MRYLASLFALSLLTACASEPFPHPPTYLSTSDIPAITMPAPTPRNSAAFEAEVKAIVQLQTQTSATTIAQAEIQRKVNPEMVAEFVLGKNFNRTEYPKTYYMLDRVGSDNWRISDAAKQFWNTKRPFVEDARVKALITPLYQPAYPSGHTSASGIWAETLVMLVPQYATALRARHSDISLNRVRAGMHYPHDLEGGKWLVKRELELLKSHPQFQADMNAARAELTAKDWLK